MQFIKRIIVDKRVYIQCGSFDKLFTISHTKLYRVAQKSSHYQMIKKSY